MKRLSAAICLFLFVFVSTTDCGTDSNTDLPEPVFPDREIWVSAYLASWDHHVDGEGHLPAEEIDWDAFTHLIYFHIFPTVEGIFPESVDDFDTPGYITSSRVNNIVTAAREHNTPILIAIGGWGTYDQFSNAIRPENRKVFIAGIMNILNRWGFDGIDVDMEPIRNEDVENYKDFIKELHQAMQEVVTSMGSSPLLFAATEWQPEMFNELQDYFDQINLMTYDYSGAWDEWVSWYNSPLYNGGDTFPESDRPLPSVHGTLQKFIRAGVDRRKLSIGTSFYSYIWHGQVDGPRQGWKVPPEVEKNVPYHEMMEDYAESGRYHWDEQAKAAWIGISSEDSTQRKFISFDDERAIREKIDYVRDQGIGGIMIWELTGGYRGNMPAGKRDPLLQTVKEAKKNLNK